MPRLFAAVAVLLAAALPLAAEERTAIRLSGRTYSLPAGFTLELVAGPPLVERPVSCDFDDRGRLYVTEASGTNDKVEKQLADKPHRVLRLEDTGGDGRFDRRTVFADKMMLPQGCLWHAGSVYVAAPPSIWKLTDTNGDGVADVREEWFRGGTLTGCANDLHGPYRGRDGWLYWTKGAFAKQTYTLPNGRRFETRAAHVFRARPDGTGVEPVMTGGMDNPVGLAFTPGGERIVSATFLQHPAGGRRDGLIHAVYGGVYGKENSCNDGHPRTGPDLMPIMTHLGPAAPAGLALTEAAGLGAEYRHNLFCACFNLHKVTRHVLVPDGATFRTVDHDFLTCDDLDFHPTDVKEDADGSLLVVDTGGWYKLCCPTSVFHKPDVTGAIYRIRPQGTRPPADPRGRAIDWATQTPAQLANLLADGRPAVRQRATEALAKHGRAGAEALAWVIGSSPAPEVRRAGVWASAWMDEPEARELARTALADADEMTRQAAAHVASVRRDAAALEPLLTTLRTSKTPQVRRAAMEALGRTDDVRAYRPLQAAAAAAKDEVLGHSAIFAILELGPRVLEEPGVGFPANGVPRINLIVTDQLRPGTLSAATIAPLLTANDDRLCAAAKWVAGRHPDWADALLRPLRSCYDGDFVLRFIERESVQHMLADMVTAPASTPHARYFGLTTIANAKRKVPPPAWADAVAAALADPDDMPFALAAARGLSSPKLTDALTRLARDASKPEDVRVQAMVLLPALDADAVRFLIGQFHSAVPLARRLAVAEAFARVKVSGADLKRVATAAADIGSIELERLWPAFATSTDDGVGLALVESLRAPALRASLQVEALKPRLDRFGPRTREAAATLYAAIEVDAAQKRQKLDALFANVKGGDVRRGQAIFGGTKAVCATCHAVGYVGGSLGPDLTKIGATRSERDLLEAIVFPSASFVRGYEPVTVTTRGGKTVSGILKRDADDGVVVATAADKEERVERKDVASVEPGAVSLMPAGLDQQLTPQELADLVAFLKACR